MTKIEKIERFGLHDVQSINGESTDTFIKNEIANTMVEYLMALEEEDQDQEKINKLERAIQTMSLASIALGLRGIEYQLETISASLERDD